MIPSRLAAALIIGFTLRVAAAALTEYRSPFPSHYYNDAKDAHANAMTLLSFQAGDSRRIDISPGSILYTKMTSSIYMILGPNPIWPKLLNAAASTAAALLWYRIATAIVPPAAAMAVFWAMLLWPTNIFYGSQHVRDAYIQLLTAAAFISGVALWGDEKPPFWKRTGTAAAVLFLLGLYRPHSLAFVAGSLLAAGAATAVAAKSKLLARRAALGVIVLAATTGIFQMTSVPLLFTIQPRPEDAPNVGDARLLPGPVEEIERPAPLLTPQGLTQFRAYRHLAARRWAKDKRGDVIASQVLVDAQFHTWMDVIAFLPKGMLYAMFMPLPGLYPSEGKLGRLLASGENLLLVAVFLLAAWSWRRPLKAPLTWPLGIFFSLCALSYGLFEFDLGSATRHRLQYFPALLPFAAASAMDLRARWTSSGRKARS